MWKKLSLYVCLITILCSCQKQRSAYAPPTFPEVKKIHAHRLSDELLISYPLDMAVSEDYIFILALADNADCSRPLSTGMDCILTEFAPLFIKKQAQ